MRVIANKTPTLIRVSLGSDIVLGLLKGKLDALPTTAYLMTYRKGKCAANCGFCPQARKSLAKEDMLSRVIWPTFPTANVLNGIEKAMRDNRIKRVCLQALNYPEVFTHLISLTKAIHQKVDVPVSISCQPLNIKNIKLLSECGIERIGIALDAATKQIFDNVKGVVAGGPYDWEKQFNLLREAVNVFGKGKISTHLIAGLGETEKEMVEIIQKCVDIGVLPALFAFTPILGTALAGLPQPQIKSYRQIQIARYLIVHGIVKFENMQFDEEERIRDFGVGMQTLMRIIQTGEPFRTSGCPDCNRPYYNEKPSGPIYNYPEKLTEKELSQIYAELDLNWSLKP